MVKYSTVELLFNYLEYISVIIWMRKTLFYILYDIHLDEIACLHNSKNYDFICSVLF